MIRIGIAGYGNLGRGLVLAIAKNPDLSLEVILTRRDPARLLAETLVPVARLADAAQWQNAVDVMVLCSGSATDLPEQGPQLARLFHTVDSFDTHARIPAYFSAMNQAALETGHLSLISCGWDPGLFSLARVLFNSVLPDGHDYTFWGKGVSQGHSDAIRRIPGVQDARQYTMPYPQALTAARGPQNPSLAIREKHWRDCYIVAEPGADRKAIEQAVVTMPDYFADYETKVTFISQEELQTNHGTLPHGGFVIRNAETSPGCRQVAELQLQLDSNPEFTASTLAAYARAVARLAKQGQRGAITVLDIPVAALSPLPPERLRAEFI